MCDYVMELINHHPITVSEVSDMDDDFELPPNSL